MKTLLSGVVALISLGVTSGLAADLHTKPNPVTLLEPAYSWTGVYVGLNAGWIGSGSDRLTNRGTDTGAGGFGTLLAVGSIPGAVNQDYNGFIGGGQIGYNWQSGNFVYGVEADIDGASASRSRTVPSVTVPGFLASTTNYTRELNWLATLRGRIGYTIMPTLLVYGTGGLAVGDTSIGNGLTAPTFNPPGFLSNRRSEISAGWTVGAGAEWAFAQKWSVKAEYLYVDLGRHRSTLTYAYGVSTSTLTTSARDTAHIARVGINYKF